MSKEKMRRPVRTGRTTGSGATLIALALGLAQPAAADSDWNPVPNDTARIIFEAPGLDRRSSARKETSSSWYEVAIFRSGRGDLPRAGLHHTELWPGYLFPTKQDLKDAIKGWSYLEGEVLRFSKEVTLVNKLGRVVYSRFSKGPGDCFAFLSYFGEVSSGDNDWGVPMQFVEGYYCAPEKIDDAVIEAALGTLFVEPR